MLPQIHYEKLAEKYAAKFKGTPNAASILKEVLENDNPYRTTLERLVRKVLEVHDATMDLYNFARSHGMMYVGPTFEEEIEDAKDILGMP